MLKNKLYFTYLLRCNDGTYYTGKTINIEKRLLQHNGKLQGGAKYTKTRRPVALHYFEQFHTHKEAILREIALKKLSHKMKNALHNENNFNITKKRKYS
jgi:putative endonuclease